MSTSYPARIASPTPYIVHLAWVLVLLMGVGTITAGDGADPLPPLTAKAGASNDGDLGGPACLYLGAQTCIPPPAGLVSWWPGAGSAEDLVGTSHLGRRLRGDQRRHHCRGVERLPNGLYLCYAPGDLAKRS
ncbi:MAG: hypothetical protein GY835_05245 [bacterium]|nr:hypothetical protein [bacterium]